MVSNHSISGSCDAIRSCLKPRSALVRLLIVEKGDVIVKNWIRKNLKNIEWLVREVEYCVKRRLLKWAVGRKNTVCIGCFQTCCNKFFCPLHLKGYSVLPHTLDIKNLISQNKCKSLQNLSYSKIGSEDCARGKLQVWNYIQADCQESLLSKLPLQLRKWIFFEKHFKKSEPMYPII